MAETCENCRFSRPLPEPGPPVPYPEMPGIWTVIFNPTSLRHHHAAYWLAVSRDLELSRARDCVRCHRLPHAVDKDKQGWCAEYKAKENAYRETTQ